ncbi:alpha/beta fold hydrolase, partial [Nocardia blacklockiae]|uniref:alpha/beta fold hydrolase n=1 Tax=Nocardia blacklockiae TaxID=480036 RepID=UPI001E49E751
ALRRLTADLTAGLLDPADAARILLVYGDRDRLVPPDHGPRLHRLVPTAHYATVTHSSHFPHIDRPAATTRLIQAFLTDTGP